MSCRSKQLDISLRNTGIGWIDKQGHGACGRDQLVQHLQPLWRYFHVHIGHACDVATWPIKTGNESEPDGSEAVSKTIGIVVVAAFATTAASVEVAAITAT